MKFFMLHFLFVVMLHFFICCDAYDIYNRRMQHKIWHGGIIIRLLRYCYSMDLVLIAGSLVFEISLKNREGKYGGAHGGPKTECSRVNSIVK